MASSSQPGRRARHPASSTSSIILADLSAMLRPRVARGLSRPGPTVAKASALMAAGSLVLALVVPSEPASASAEVSAAGALAADAGVSAGAGTLAVARERTAQRASRSVARAAVAVSAPTVAAPATPPSFGAMSFKAEEKPPPPPPPPPPPAAKSSGGSSGTAARSNRSSGSSSSGRGSGYDWNAANSCSCARGLTQNSMRVLAAVKYSFPNMKSIGGVRPDSLADHPSGRALDFMTTNKGFGDSIANMLISRSGELNIEYIIWYQRIWFPGKGWRHMENRGGATANHMDHVHVTVR